MAAGAPADAAPATAGDGAAQAAPAAEELTRLLVCGDCCGRFAELFRRVEAVQQQHGPFAALLCVGDFFAKGTPHGGCSEEDAEWLTGAHTIPVPTYFIVGNEGMPAAHDHPDGAQICADLHFLGQQGVATIAGLRVAFLSGRHEALVYQHTVGRSVGAYTKASVTALCKETVRQPGGIDVLLTAEWARDVLCTEPTSYAGGSAAVRELARHCAPRYHFAGTEGLFFKRRPYANARPGALTQFVGLGKVGGGTDAHLKWLYACAVAAGKCVAGEPSESPFERKRKQRDDGAAAAAVGGCHKRRPGYGGGAELRTDPECWFCLDGPKAERHLVVHELSQAYLALPKGALCKMHMLVIPRHHFYASDLVPDSVRAQMQRYVAAVRRIYDGVGRALVVFERNIAMGGGGKGGNTRVGTPVHLHLQLVPVPRQRAKEVEKAFCQGAAARGFQFRRVAPGALLPAEFFLVTLPDGAQLLYGKENIYEQFDMQFGRRVLAHFLGTPERADWKDCKVADVEEAREAAQLRELIEAELK